VRQQHAERDVPDRALGRVDLAQLRQPGDDAVVEREEAAVPELHDGDGGERLGDGRPVVDGALVHGLAQLAVGEAAEVPCRHPAVLHQHRAGTDDAVARREGVHGLYEPVPAAWRRRAPLAGGR
jgi:hypothetical protein